MLRGSLSRARRRSLPGMGATLSLCALALAGLPASAQAAASLPCDIYAAAGTPCVAAHSTVRALYGAYDGRLYQVTRASDRVTQDIRLLSTGGYADAAAQDTFCRGTRCTITKIYDQSPRHNHLTVEGGGTANSAPDAGAGAGALPVNASGHRAYGVSISPGMGYRHTAAAGVATNGRPEGMYMVTSAHHVNGSCCFDYGNAEIQIKDTGKAHMDAVYFGTRCAKTPPCRGSGPWVEADLEDGLYLGSGSNLGDLGNTSAFVTAMLKNDGRATFALKGGNAQSGRLSTWYDGALPPGYSPMHQEGSIVLGTGGDNSNWASGDFYEGVMTAGYPTPAADDAVQASIVAAGYRVPAVSP
jgi:non-reducing end alpha-L-arabinofuranosidase